MMQMMSLDIYLSSLSNEEYRKVKKQIPESSIKTMPLQSWDIYSQHFRRLLSGQRRQNTINTFKEIAQKFQWENKIDELFENRDFEALVLTDLKNEIQWVSEGFTEMTGYSKQFALNKTPKFLQGKDTDAAVIERIRYKLSRDLAFKEVLVNYKKDRTPYRCEISVVPLLKDKTTHYLALERQIA